MQTSSHILTLELKAVTSDGLSRVFSICRMVSHLLYGQELCMISPHGVVV